jgi:hypothetical protein
LDPALARQVSVAIAMREPRGALHIGPAALSSQLEPVRDRLAVVAAHHGTDGGFWGLWLAVVEATGETTERAIERLSEKSSGRQGFWLAAWAFANQTPALGFTAYEHHLTEVAPSEGLNKFRSWIYAGWALREGQARRAHAALAPALARCGSDPSGEVLVAALGALAGKTPKGAALRVVTGFARSTDTLVRAARAVALDALGMAGEALAVVASFDRKVVFAPEIVWLLRDRFGAAFDEAIGRAHVPLAKSRRVPGFVAAPSARSTPHEFAPKLPPGPPCPGCRRPLRTWFAFDVTKIAPLHAQLPRWTRFVAPACFDCDLWMVRHDYLAESGGFVLEGSEPARKSLGKPMNDYSARPLARQFVKLTRAASDLQLRPLDGECQVGGVPAWIQDPVELNCAGCDTPMVFVFRLSAPNDFTGCPEPAGGSGALYFFACPECPRFSVFAQWT